MRALVRMGWCGPCEILLVESWQAIILHFVIASVIYLRFYYPVLARFCVSGIVAIYNLKYRNLYNGIFKGGILYYGLLRPCSPRNDAVENCHCEQVFKLAWQSIMSDF